MPDDARSESPTFDMRTLAGSRWPVPEWHFETIAAELGCAESKERMMRVVTTIPQQRMPDFSGIDWDRALAAFGEIDYPRYYTQPFHSVPGGYLSEAAATQDRGAMEAIYQDAHPRRSLGLREALAALMPADAARVVDLGAGTGDTAAAIARRLPSARVIGIDASPFMVIAGRHQNAGISNLELRQGFAEHTGLEADSIDAVNITLVFHEMPDVVKERVLFECRRILRPGGRLVLSDTPHDDLHDYRGFYEPYKEQWLVWDELTTLGEAGFVGMERRDVAPPLWSVVCQKPG